MVGSIHRHCSLYGGTSTDTWFADYDGSTGIWRDKCRAFRVLERLAAMNRSAFVHWERGVFTAAR